MIIAGNPADGRAIIWLLIAGQFVRKLDDAGKSHKIFRCFLIDIESCERLRQRSSLKSLYSLKIFFTN
jgi:hypothetical protein